MGICSGDLVNGFECAYIKTCRTGEDLEVTDIAQQAGILAIFSQEDQIMFGIDLGDHNEGASLTNCSEAFEKYALAMAEKHCVPNQWLKIIQIDSMGYIDTYRNGVWRPFGHDLKIGKPARSMEMLKFVLNDRFPDFLRALSGMIAPLGIRMALGVDELRKTKASVLKLYKES